MHMHDLFVRRDGAAKVIKEETEACTWMPYMYWMVIKSYGVQVVPCSGVVRSQSRSTVTMDRSDRAHACVQPYVGVGRGIHRVHDDALHWEEVASTTAVCTWPPAHPSPSGWIYP